MGTAPASRQATSLTQAYLKIIYEAMFIFQHVKTMAMVRYFEVTTDSFNVFELVLVGIMGIQKDQFHLNESGRHKFFLSKANCSQGRDV
jgi:hypothetical protein